MKYLVVLISIISLCGCIATSYQKEAPQGLSTADPEASSALHSVAEAMSGQDLNEERLRSVAQDIQNDQETRTAVQAVTESMQGRRVVKYCPICGRRYSSRLKFCPIHHVPLEVVK